HKKFYLKLFSSKYLLSRTFWLFFFLFPELPLGILFKDFAILSDRSLFWLRHCSVLKDLRASAARSCGRRFQRALLV
ncbi:MAG: hypothetical protein IIZ45_05885, partial [Firmicutes bacterium]|nr:hypothetical protein [Bacillota bacterium]